MVEKAQNSVKIAPGGDVTTGPRTVIHPKATDNIINGYPENIAPDAEQVGAKPMIIGTNNIFEVGCYFQVMKIGDYNVIDFKAFVGRNVIFYIYIIIIIIFNFIYFNNFTIVLTFQNSTSCLLFLRVSAPPQMLHPVQPAPLHPHRYATVARELPLAEKNAHTPLTFLCVDHV
uniref:Dynactin subunit 6 n=1 Tax=Podarcis muralis TaxID=64176 RepID=A0A670JRP9_PODMU